MGAVFSHDGIYRYLLSRTFSPPLFDQRPSKYVAFVMLNPSTADDRLDDPTIRRCKSFASREGATNLVVANLYAFRATRPEDLWKAADPVGEWNDMHLESLVQADNTIICAWGANARPDRVKSFATMASKWGRQLMCLGTTKDGQPRHPLYVRADQPLVPWKMPAD